MPRRTFPIVLALIVFISGVSLGQEQKKTETEVEYLAAFLNNQKIGHSVRTRTATPDKVTTTDQMGMSISRLGIVISIKATETTIETPDGKPLAFESVIENLGLMNSKTIKTGKITDQGKLEITTTENDRKPQKETIDWPADALMSEGLDLLAKKKGLKEGIAYSVKAFVPDMTSYFVDIDVKVGTTKNIDLLGRVVSLTEVASTMRVFNIPIVSTEYYDKEFKVQKSITPLMGMNLEIIACDKTFALSENDPADFLDRFLLPSPRPIENVKTAPSITYHLTPLEKEELDIPVGDNQTVRTDETGNILVTVKPVGPPAGIKIPYMGKDPEIIKALQPTQYLQSDDKEIIALAQKAVGETTDAAEAARKIEKFVYDYIDEKNLAVGYATAFEVAQSRQGDCSEHALLTAALCRAVGLPAQVVCGMLYVEKFGDRENIFGPHAWVRVYIGGKWVGLDATRAPDGFSAGHITLAAGSGNLRYG